MTFLMFGFI